MMPCVATSFARVRANPVTAARMLFDRIKLSTGCFTAIEVTLMIRPQCRSRIPGNTARFTLVVNNTSSQADSYDLAASTVNTFAAITLPPGWTVTFRNGANAVIASTGPIAGGGNMLVYADVAVPAGNGSGNTEMYFRARSPVSTAADAIHDQVGVNASRVLTLTPNNTAQVLPGGFVVYTHTLANNNIVSQSVAHMHVHVVPRTRGDGLRGFFWPRRRYADGEAEVYADRLRHALAGAG